MVEWSGMHDVGGGKERLGARRRWNFWLLLQWRRQWE